ncbi:MAPEG family protein [Sphingomonas piscis]|uniref:MAPEG family protein n=1 Tax=Sphingomonas piscis TaxID=2714943 RepID=A0A6G7YLJ2_9SPHN|nr:MAPEG family protein [Sphingomonas piscis]QIK77608.1 MAPEG family protein [Sphingomonas piscis]
MHSPLLGPVVALVAWTLIVMLWMFVARGRQFRELGVTADNIPVGARGTDLEGKGDPRAQWKSHNYNHLMEQPTIFYAIVFALILMEFDAPINVWLAWGYVGFRVVHSIVQGTINVVKYRFLFFLLSTICLVGLTTHAVLKLLHG